MVDKNYLYNSDISTSRLSLLDHHTGKIRKSLYKFGNITLYFHVEMNTHNKITYYECIERVGGKIVLNVKMFARYNEKQGMIEYVDSSGNCWKKDWEVPFLHTHKTRRIFTRARHNIDVAKIYHTNICGGALST